MQEPWLSLSNRVANCALCRTAHAAPALWQPPCTHTERWSGPSPFLHGGPGGAWEARRGSAGGQQARSCGSLAGFFSGEEGAGNRQSVVIICFNELTIRLSTGPVLQKGVVLPLTGWPLGQGNGAEAVKHLRISGDRLFQLVGSL